jgi:hypothetical protein
VERARKTDAVWLWMELVLVYTVYLLGLGYCHGSLLALSDVQRDFYWKLIYQRLFDFIPKKRYLWYKIYYGCSRLA